MSVCGVCELQPSKYKCPTCGLPYCSLACFRPHKDLHTLDSVQKPTEHPLPAKPVEPQPPPPPPAPTSSASSPFQILLETPELEDLLKRRPALRPHLETIFSSTIEPSDDQPRPFKPIKGADGRFRGRHRTRPKGPWTQQQGDTSALQLIALARTNRRDLNADGMEEFVRLVCTKCGGAESMR